jgi:hypothetical protein
MFGILNMIVHARSIIRTCFIPNRWWALIPSALEKFRKASYRRRRQPGSANDQCAQGAVNTAVPLHALAM